MEAVPVSMRLKVSSNHLRLSSNEEMQKPEWNNGSKRSLIEFGHLPPEDSCDEQTLEIIMSVINGRTRTAPRELSLEQLAVVGWFSKLKDGPEVSSASKRCSQKLILWIAVFCTLSEKTQLALAVNTIVRYCDENVRTLGLSINNNFASTDPLH